MINTICPQFEESKDFSLLLCPHCGNNYLHHDSVDVSFRDKEDSETGLSVSVQGGHNDELPTASIGGKANSIGRRDSITISFWCENCHEKSELAVMQHKGQTELFWLD